MVVMSTTNGTKAAHAAARTAKHVLLASLYNAHAAARLARELATEEVAILCAGKEGRAGLDDLYTAGVLAEYLGFLGEVEPEDGARVALAVKRAYPDPLEALSLSAAALALKQVGPRPTSPSAPRWPKAPPSPSSGAGWARPSSSSGPEPPGSTKAAHGGSPFGGLSGRRGGRGSPGRGGWGPVPAPRPRGEAGGGRRGPGPRARGRGRRGALPWP